LETRVESVDNYVLMATLLYKNILI